MVTVISFQATNHTAISSDVLSRSWMVLGWNQHIFCCCIDTLSRRFKATLPNTFRTKPPLYEYTPLILSHRRNIIGYRPLQQRASLSEKVPNKTAGNMKSLYTLVVDKVQQTGESKQMSKERENICHNLIAQVYTPFYHVLKISQSHSVSCKSTYHTPGINVVNSMNHKGFSWRFIESHGPTKAKVTRYQSGKGCTFSFRCNSESWNLFSLRVTSCFSCMKLSINSKKPF